MTAVTAPPRAGGVRPVVVQLALAEGRRLVRHPLVLIGLALSLAAGVGAAMTPHHVAGELQLIMLTGAGQWPLAVGALLAGNLTALRARRYGTPELEDTTVTTPATRTLGLLTGTVALTLLTVVLVTVDAAMFQIWNGIPVRMPDGFVWRSMHVTELLQGPLAVTAMAVLGITLGRWMPSRLLGPLLLVPAVIGFFHVMWRFDGTPWRFAPVMAHEQQVAWVQATPSRGYSIIGGFAMDDLAWHLVYVVGVTVLLGVAAVARSGRPPWLGHVALAGLVLAVVGGVLQLP